MIIPEMIPFNVLAFITGMVFGSFLNVLIYRLPREIGFGKGFSKCTTCGHRLMPIDLVPLFSWLYLKGKCRYCGQSIPYRYPMVELLNGVLFTLASIQFGMSAQTVIYCAIIFCLIGIAFTDWEHMMIPDTYHVIMVISGLLLLYLEPEQRAERLIGSVIISGVFFLIVVLSKGRAMGFGDVKMMFALGLCIGAKQIIFIMFLGAILGTIVYIILRFTNHSLKRQVPFGTFLAIAGIVSIFVGTALVAWYFGLLDVHNEHDGHIH